MAGAAEKGERCLRRWQPELIDALSQFSIDPDKLIGNFKQLGGDVETILKALITHGGDIFNTLKSGVTQGFGDFFGGSKDSASPRIVGQILGVIGDMVHLPLTKIAKDIGEKGWDAALDVGGMILEAVNLSWDGLLGAVGEVLGGKGAAIVGFVASAVGEGIEEGKG